MMFTWSPGSNENLQYFLQNQGTSPHSLYNYCETLTIQK